MVLELFYSLSHPHYPLKFVTTLGSQCPVFLVEFSCMVSMERELHLLSKSETQWLAALKHSYKGVRWTETVFFKEVAKL